MSGSLLQRGMQDQREGDLTTGGNPSLSLPESHVRVLSVSHPRLVCLVRVSVKIGWQEGEATTKVVWRRKGRVKRKSEGGDGLSEGGVHSSVEFDDFQRFIALQVGTDQVLLQL